MPTRFTTRIKLFVRVRQSKLEQHDSLTRQGLGDGTSPLDRLTRSPRGRRHDRKCGERRQVAATSDDGAARGVEVARAQSVGDQRRGRGAQAVACCGVDRRAPPESSLQTANALVVAPFARARPRSRLPALERRHPSRRRLLMRPHRYTPSPRAQNPGLCRSVELEPAVRLLASVSCPACSRLLQMDT